MAVQIVNTYGYNVKRISLSAPKNPAPGQSSPFLQGPEGGYTGEQVFVVAANQAAALAVLQAQFGADLGTVTGGGTHVYGCLTTMTGS